MRKQTQGSSLVQGDVFGLVALDLVLRVVQARVMDVALVVHVLAVNPQDSAAMIDVRAEK